MIQQYCHKLVLGAGREILNIPLEILKMLKVLKILKVLKVLKILKVLEVLKILKTLKTLNIRPSTNSGHTLKMISRAQAN